MVVELEKVVAPVPETIDLVSKSRTLVIRTNDQYVQACGEMFALKDMIANRYALHDPTVEKAFAAHKQAIAARSADISPLEEAKRIYERAIDGWRREQDRMALEAARIEREQREREAQAERVRIAAEANAERDRLEAIAAQEREAEIIEAESAGASVAEVTAIIERPLIVAPVYEEPVYVAPVTVRPTVPQVQGIRKKPDNWKAALDPRDPQAKAKLIRFVSTSPQFSHLLILDTSAANSLAKALKTTMSIPGLAAWNDNA
jgi:hypothetical protein